MTKLKADSLIKVRWQALLSYLRTSGIKMDAGLYCYVFLVMKRPDLFGDFDQRFIWRKFRGISITARDCGEVETFLDEFILKGDYPELRTVRANLINPTFMKKAAPQIEWDIIRRELRDNRIRRDIIAEMSRGFERLDSFRRLLEREPNLRLLDVKRRLHMSAGVARWLISHEEKVGHVRVRQFSPRGSLWIMSCQDS